MKKKRKMKTKNMLLLILFIILIALVGFGIYKGISKEEKFEVVLSSNKIEIHNKIIVKELISEVKKGRLVNEDQEVDTTQLGKKKIILEIEDNDQKKYKQEIEIEVVDTKSPVIQAEETVTVKVGASYDPLKDVTATDNSNEEIKVTMEGDYDLQKEGEYTIRYFAKDSSGNEAKKTCKLIVSSTSTPRPSPSPSANEQTFTTNKGYKGITKDGLTYIDGVLIANKTYSLPKNYGSGLTSETQSAFNTMKNAAAQEGITLTIISGYRSYDRQNTLYNNYVNKDGKSAADTYSARPGHSEHQTGLAFDLNSLNTSFANTAEGKWLANNASKYGFILRYPKGKTNETGYIYEPWHFRYVGEELASKVYNGGDWITLENYFGITSEYAN